MAFNPLTLLQERQCAPIYDALDSGKPSLALKLCDGLIKSQPDLHFASTLRSIALIRLGRREEANAQVDTLISSKAADKNASILKPLCMALTSLDRADDEVALLDAASKASPTSLEIGAKAFSAMIKAKEWQKAQQTSLRLHKLMSSKDKSNDEYFWSSMQVYSLVASDPTLSGSQLALPLAQRMIAKHLESHPFGPHSDEVMFLYATILRKMGPAQQKEALELLNSDGRGRELCKRSMTLATLRYELMEELGEWQTIYDEALEALEGRERNWSRVQEAVKAAICLDSLDDIESRLTNLSETKSKDRTLKLAPLYLIKEVRHAGKAIEGSNLLELFLSYFQIFSTKSCAYEDLAPYVPLLSEQEVQSALQVLFPAAKPPAGRSFADLNSLYINLNACKLARLMHLESDITADSELKSGEEFFALYLCAIPLGKDLPKTEMQPADDYALLAAQSLVNASILQRRKSDDNVASSTLLLAIVLLTAALRYCPRGYRLRVLLIQLLRQCGHVNLARKEYEEIGVKSVQQDTLGWILASRGSTLVSLYKSGSEEQRSFVTAVQRLDNVYKEGRTQVPSMVAKCFESGIYSRVEEMVDFGHRLDQSMTKWLLAVETARSAALQKKGKDITKELLECSASLAKGKVSDQQDYGVLLNLMPHSCPSIEALTSLGTPKYPGLNYLNAMLPVAMLHQGVTPESIPTSFSAADELTETEILLSQLAIELSRDEVQGVARATSALFENVQQILASHCKDDLPDKALCSVSLALEAYQLLIIVSKRRGGSLREEIKTAIASLSAIVNMMQKLDWDETNPTISKEWASLLNKLPSGLRGGDDGPTLTRRKAQELKEARTSAMKALTDRLERSLNDDEP